MGLSPSTAFTTSQKEISSGFLLSLYPPLTPDTELTIPALDSLPNTFDK